MSDFVIGIPIGIAIGISIGISIGVAMGTKQKPWSEMTGEEKKGKKLLVSIALIILIIGFLVNILLFFGKV
jgi:ABC-type nickel/cobalt efflux system permease component RcnA